MSNRRADPNFAQVSGYLPKELVTRFKQVLVSKDLKMQEGLEEAVKLYVERQTGTDNVSGSM